MGPSKELSSIDIDQCQEMEEIVEKMTTSGKPDLDTTLLKRIKTICKYAFDFQITGKKRFQISVFQICKSCHCLCNQIRNDNQLAIHASHFILVEIWVRSQVLNHHHSDPGFQTIRCICQASISSHHDATGKGALRDPSFRCTYHPSTLLPLPLLSGTSACRFSVLYGTDTR